MADPTQTLDRPSSSRVRTTRLKPSVGDTAVMRKPHPCGGSEWTVTRVGADVGLRCARCGRRTMLAREAFERGVKKLLPISPETSLWDPDAGGSKGDR